VPDDARRKRIVARDFLRAAVFAFTTRRLTALSRTEQYSWKTALAPALSSPPADSLTFLLKVAILVLIDWFLLRHSSEVFTRFLALLLVGISLFTP
jgi:hypothetical protein